MEPIILEDTSTLLPLPKDPKFYFRKSTLLYGESESGKSKFVREICFLTKDLFPAVFCVSQTDKVNSEYSKMLPKGCVKKTFDVEWIAKLYKRQEDVADIYNNYSNNSAILKQIFRKVASYDVVFEEEKMLKVYEDALSRIDYGNKAERDDLEKMRNNNMAEFYRKHIRLQMQKINQFGNDKFEEKELITIKFLDLVPDVLLIMDDCSSLIKKNAKSEVIHNVFYQGRHIYITLIFTFQGDKDITPELRRNAFVSIFTTAGSAHSHFETATNQYTKEQKARSRLCINKVYPQIGENDTYKKLIYIRGLPGDKFRYAIANIYQDFEMGGQYVRKFCEQIAPVKRKEDNSLIQRMII